MTAPRIVTTEEARRRFETLRRFAGVTSNLTVLTDKQEALLYTVATEPERTRAAVVKALREVAEWVDQNGPACGYHCDNVVRSHIEERAETIENGADW